MRLGSSFDQSYAYSGKPQVSNLRPNLFIMEKAPIRILVVEDFTPFREFIRSTLGQRADLHVIGEVSDGEEAVQKAADLKPDLILLDIGLPTIDGLEVARQVRRLTPQSKIIFLTQESSREVVQAALGLGAWGYVVKAKAGGDLLTAVETALRRKRFVSGGLPSQDCPDTGRQSPGDY